MKVTRQIRLGQDAKTFATSAAVEVFDVNDTLVQADCATEAATRLPGPNRGIENPSVARTRHSVPKYSWLRPEAWMRLCAGRPAKTFAGPSRRLVLRGRI